jgi:hypothetical protein
VSNWTCKERGVSGLTIRSSRARFAASALAGYDLTIANAAQRPGLAQALDRMNLIASPYSNGIDWFSGSTITEVSDTLSGLRIVVGAAWGDGRFCEIHFANARAFQSLAESDMLSYWQQPLTSRCFVYQVTAGGWLERVSDHYFQVASLDGDLHEWLIVADAGSVVTVLAAEPPHIRDYGHAV